MTHTCQIRISVICFNVDLANDAICTISSPYFLSKKKYVIQSTHCIVMYRTLVLTVKQDRLYLQISLGVAWCSTRSEECMSHVVIMADAKIEIGPCVSNVTLPVLTRPADTPSKCLCDTPSKCLCDTPSKCRVSATNVRIILSGNAT